MPWIDTETGEVAADCPLCAATRDAAEIQVHGMELERRKDRSAMTRLKNEMEAAKVAKRDGAVWNDLLACWQSLFPDKRLTATGIRSARATAVFARLESGASVEDVKDAIAGVTVLPYLHFGNRVDATPRRDAVLAIDLQDIMSLTKDANFDALRDAGYPLRHRNEDA